MYESSINKDEHRGPNQLIVKKIRVQRIFFFFVRSIVFCHEILSLKAELCNSTFTPKRTIKTLHVKNTKPKQTKPKFYLKIIMNSISNEITTEITDLFCLSFSLFSLSLSFENNYRVLKFVFFTISVNFIRFAVSDFDVSLSFYLFFFYLLFIFTIKKEKIFVY